MNIRQQQKKINGIKTVIINKIIPINTCEDENLYQLWKSYDFLFHQKSALNLVLLHSSFHHTQVEHTHTLLILINITDNRLSRVFLSILLLLE